MHSIKQPIPNDSNIRLQTSVLASTIVTTATAGVASSIATSVASGVSATALVSAATVLALVFVRTAVLALGSSNLCLGLVGPCQLDVLLQLVARELTS